MSRPEALIRAEAAVEMRDLAVAAVRECGSMFEGQNAEERILIEMLIDTVAGRVQALRLKSSP